MTAIYCVKCRNTTNTKSEKRVTSANGRNRLTGICDVCGKKKGMFVGKDWKITKTPKELEEARNMRLQYSLKNGAGKFWQIRMQKNVLIDA